MRQPFRFPRDELPSRTDCNGAAVAAAVGVPVGDDPSGDALVTAAIFGLEASTPIIVPACGANPEIDPPSRPEVDSPDRAASAAGSSEADCIESPAPLEVGAALVSSPDVLAAAAGASIVGTVVDTATSSSWVGGTCVFAGAKKADEAGPLFPPAVSLSAAITMTSKIATKLVAIRMLGSAAGTSALSRSKIP